MIKENLDLEDGLTAQEVYSKVKTTGIRGLDIEKAKELGVFDRIANTLCAVHSTIVAAYRIYGDVDYLLSEIGGKKNDIAKAMNDYERAYARFFSFWTRYYSDNHSNKDMNDDIEALYHHIMEWAELPENWQLGDEQKKERANIAIKLNLGAKDTLYLHNSVVETKQLTEPIEEWCVTKINIKTRKQTTVNVGLDKTDALFSAKRLSANDAENVYTASMIIKKQEETINVSPFKAFCNNKTIGKVKSITKK